MDFISAVIAIEKHPDLELCPNEDERSGVLDICVYRRHGDFIGKLRWPRLRDSGATTVPAEVDPEVEALLQDGTVKVQA
jgi:hypothetical protein